MTEHLKNFLDGIRQSLTLSPGSVYVIPKRGDFQRDANALRGDVALIGKDMRKALKKAHDGR